MLPGGQRSEVMSSGGRAPTAFGRWGAGPALLRHGGCMSVGWVRFLPQKSEDRGGSSVFLFVIERTSLSAFCHRHSFHGRLVSRVLCVRRRRDHLSVTAVADSLSATSEDSDGQPRVSSLLTAVLLPIGFTLTGFVSEAPVGSYPAFSPLHFCRSFLLHFP